MRKIVVLLACLLLPTSGRIQDDVAEESRARHLFVQRDKPLPGSPKKLLKIEREEPSRSSGGQNVHEVFRRVRRSLNPDMKPEAHRVSLSAVVCTLKILLVMRANGFKRHSGVHCISYCQSNILIFGVMSFMYLWFFFRVMVIKHCFCDKNFFR